ncbi:MAG: VOC family protein [Propionibacteriales bacterium]|nr:VOC family protein [Propionibacteriales bacterium]
MASRLNPYIQFADTAGAALEFYRSVLGGEVAVSTFGDMGTTDELLATKVMHGQLETPAGFTLMASDTPPGMEPKFAGNITISLSGDDVADLQGWFAGLSEGGSVNMPLEKQMWGDHYGHLTDKFGIDWLVNISGDAVEASQK